MKLAISLGTLAGANLFVTFLAHWYVLIAVGPGLETDALFAAMALPQLVLAVISDSLMHVLVPLLASHEEDRLRRDAWGFFLLIGAVFSGLAVSLYFLAPLWVRLMVPGFSDEGKLLTVELTRIQLIGMVLIAVSGVLWAIYYARQRFLWAESSPALASIVSLVLLFWALPRYGIVAAAWLGVVRVALQTVLLVPGLGAYCKPDWNSDALRDAWARIRPLLLGTAYYKTGPLVDRILSSLAPAGGLSVLYVGQQTYGTATQIMNKAITAPMVPLLAKYAKVGDWGLFRQAYRERLLWMAGLTLGPYILFLFLGESSLRFLVNYGGITQENVTLLWWVMLALVGVFMGGAMGQIVSSAFYARGDTATPTKVGIIGFTLGIILKVLGFFQYGLIGIATGTTLYYFLNVAVLGLLLERECSDVISA